MYCPCCQFYAWTLHRCKFRREAFFSRYDYQTTRSMMTKEIWDQHLQNCHWHLFLQLGFLRLMHSIVLWIKNAIWQWKTELGTKVAPLVTTFEILLLCLSLEIRTFIHFSNLLVQTDTYREMWSPFDDLIKRYVLWIVMKNRGSFVDSVNEQCRYTYITLRKTV